MRHTDSYLGLQVFENLKFPDVASCMQGWFEK